MAHEQSSRRGRSSFGAACIAAALVAAGASCADGGAVVLGVSGSTDVVDAARVAIADASAGAPLPALDTVMIPEYTNRAEPAIRAAGRLVSAPGMVGVVGHSNSAASLAASRIYNRAGVVQIAPTSTASLYGEAGPYSFRVVPGNRREAAFLARYLAETFPEGRRIALFYVNDAYGRDLRSTFLEENDAGRFPVVADLPHSEGDISDEDIEHALDAAAASDPGLVLWLARGSVLMRFIDGLRGALGDVPVVGGDATPPPRPEIDDEALWRGVRYAEFVDLDGTAGLRAFARRYDERLNRRPRGAELLTYDAVGLIVAGIRAGARSGDELREYLESLGRERPPFEGITGPITFDAEGNVERSFSMEPVLAPEE